MEQPTEVSAEDAAPDLPTIEAEDQADDTGTPPDAEETFPRDYVEKLRQENGRYRQRAQYADDLARRLHVELVRATGRLADPTDLPYDESHLEDPAALALAAQELVAAKPHLASRRPTGEIGQGPTTSSATVDLAALLRRKAN